MPALGPDVGSEAGSLLGQDAILQPHQCVWKNQKSQTGPSADPENNWLCTVQSDTPVLLDVCVCEVLIKSRRGLKRGLH